MSETVGERKTRVLIVDDQEIVRLGLITLINDRADMQVVGEAGDSAAAVRAIERMRPDVVLMDIRMPGEGGIDATRQVTARFPEVKVVMLTSFADDGLIVQAIRAGAVGYVLKQVGTLVSITRVSKASDWGIDSCAISNASVSSLCKSQCLAQPTG